MSQPTQKCDNCQKQFPQSKIATHYGYCRRNIKKCQQCNEMYDINNKEQHQEQFHKKIACKYCKKQFKNLEVQIHQKVCTRKTKYCQYCQLNVPVNQYDIHLKACQARTKKCDKCMKSVTNKEYFVHVATCQGQSRKQNSNSGGNSPYSMSSQNSNSSSNSYQQYLRNQNKNNKNYADLSWRMEQESSGDFRRIQQPQRLAVEQKNKNQKKPNEPRNGVIKTTGINSQPYSKATSSNSGINSNPNPSKRQYTNNYMKKQPNQPKYEDKYSIKPSYKPQVRKIQDNPPTYGIKRPIIQPKKQQPSNKYNNPSSKNPTFHKKQRIPIFDPKEYGGYQQQDISQQMLQQSYNTKQNHNRLQQFDESQQIQKAIIQSMEQKNKKKSYDGIPKQLQTQQLMRSSFSKDFDIQRQKAMYQQFQRKANKKR